MLSTVSPRGKPINPAELFVSDVGLRAAPKVVKKVLVVDDEVDLAEICSMLLKAYGLDVVTVHCAKDALQRLEQDPEIDAVLSDIVMPGMSGLQLGDAIREMYPHIRVVLVSGYTIAKEFDGRESPYLFAEKPYKIATILKLLRS